MKTVKERLDFVRQQTGCMRAAAFARWVEAKSPQAVGAWEARNSISSKGALAVHKATGADTHWLLTGDGDPFPRGPTIYAGGEPPALVERMVAAEAELDAFKSLTGTVLASISAALPDAGRAILASLRAGMPSAPDSQRLVLETAVRAVESGLQGAAPAIPRAAPGGSSRKPQSTRR